MNDRNIRAARNMIRMAAIVRLAMIALLALALAFAYSDEQENISRLYNENVHLQMIVPGFMLDMVLTILWLYRPKLHIVHLFLYIFIGVPLYFAYTFDVFNLYGISAIMALLIAPFIWLGGLIPFVMCGIGRDKLAKAEKEQEEA